MHAPQNYHFHILRMPLPNLFINLLPNDAWQLPQIFTRNFEPYTNNNAIKINSVTRMVIIYVYLTIEIYIHNQLNVAKWNLSFSSIRQTIYSWLFMFEQTKYSNINICVYKFRSFPSSIKIKKNISMNRARMIMIK